MSTSLSFIRVVSLLIRCSCVKGSEFVGFLRLKDITVNDSSNTKGFGLITLGSSGVVGVSTSFLGWTVFFSHPMVHNNNAVAITFHNPLVPKVLNGDFSII